MLAARNALSTIMSGVSDEQRLRADHPHRSPDDAENSIVVITIVVVTAMPYAAARLLDVRNPRPGRRSRSSAPS